MLAVIPVTSTGDRGEGTYLRNANDTILNPILRSWHEILSTRIGHRDLTNRSRPCSLSYNQRPLKEPEGA